MLRAIAIGTLQFALSLSLAACGASNGGDADGNAGGGGNGGGTTNLGPASATITWPPAGFLTDHPFIRVRGTAADPDGVAGVTVNGTAATSMDGFAHWEALVPLAGGTVSLVTAVEDTLAAVTSPAAPALTATRVPYVSAHPEAMAWHAPSQRHVILDSERRSLVAVDPVTGMGAELSGPFVGTGLDLIDPRDFVLDPASPNHAYVVDRTQQAVLHVDLLTGDRLIHSGPAVGTGVALSRPISIDYDTAGARLLVGDAQLDALLAVDPATGNRTELSGPSVGTGPSLAEPKRLTLWQGKALVLETWQRVLITVDLATGHRTIVSNFLDANQGLVVGAPAGCLVDETTSTAYFGAFPGNVLEVDLTTGLRTLLSAPSIGSGPVLRNVAALTHGPGANEISAFDWEFGAIRSIDRTTGDRTAVYRPARGTGTHIERPAGLALAADGQSLYLMDAYTQLLRVDVATADRVSVPVSGSPVISAQGLALDALGNRLFTRGSIGGLPVIHAVDLLTNTKSVIAGNGVGTGPMDYLRGLVFDPLQARLLVARYTPGSILGVDPAIGDRVELSGPNVGTGYATSVVDLDLVPGTGDAFVAASNGYVIAVDPTTGDRTVVSSIVVGTGPSIPVSGTIRLVFDGTAGRVLVVSRGKVMSVDPVSGERVVVSDVATGVGPVISAFGGDIALDAQRGVLWIADNGTNSLTAVDLTSGDRVVVSR